MSTAGLSCGEVTFFLTLRSPRYLLSACCRLKEIMCKLDYERTHFSLRIKNTQGVLFILNYQHTSPLHFLGMGRLGFSEHHNHPGTPILSVLVTDLHPTLLFQKLVPGLGCHQVPLPQVASSHSPWLFLGRHGAKLWREQGSQNNGGVEIPVG